MREGGGPGDGGGPAVLHRVQQRHAGGEADEPAAQLHPRLLPHRGQARGVLAPAHHTGVQKGQFQIHNL